MEQTKEKNNTIAFLDHSKKARILTLVILGVISLSIKILFFPSDLPFMGDAVGYFWYANDISILGHFPPGHISSTVLVAPPNNGWPGFLSLVFSFINSENFLDYVNAQRLTSVIISTLTIIPVYFLSKKFMNSSFAILCCSAFVFAPRLVENSLLGLTEPLFLLLGITSLVLFLSEGKKSIIFSFAIAALFSMVRYEGLLILIPFTIIYFLRFRKNKSMILRYALAIGIFLLVITPMIAIRMETTGQDGLTSHIIHGPNYYASMMEENDDDILFHFISKGTTNLVKHLAFITIPIFIIFIPYGFFKLVKNRDYKKWTMIVFGITFLIPAFYAYSRGFEDTRYLFILYPIMSLMVGYTIKGLGKRIRRPNILFYFCLVMIIFVSISFSFFTMNDFDKERELYEISKDISKLTETINREYEGLMYLKWSANDIQNEFPILHGELYDKNIKKIKYVGIKDNNFDNIESFLEYGKPEGLTHLVVDGNNMGVEIFKEVFLNEGKYPFLEKIYDSNVNGFETKVKIYKINYELMENID